MEVGKERVDRGSYIVEWVDRGGLITLVEIRGEWMGMLVVPSSYHKSIQMYKAFCIHHISLVPVLEVGYTNQP